MKLDPRIEKESLIYTPFSNKQVKLGENGYFADVMSTFYDLKECVYGELVEYNPDSDCPYWGKFDDSACPFSFYIPESSLKLVKENKTDKPLTLDEVNDMCKKCMKEISELRAELNSIKYQLNKPKLTENKSANCCVSISYPNGFNPQSNWCENTFEHK